MILIVMVKLVIAVRPIAACVEAVVRQVLVNIFHSRFNEQLGWFHVRNHLVTALPKKTNSDSQTPMIVSENISLFFAKITMDS